MKLLLTSSGATGCRSPGSQTSSPLDDTVYVGTSAGAMAAAKVFGETYTEPRAGSGRPLTSDVRIDDASALAVTDGVVEVVSEGHWKLFAPRTVVISGRE